MSLTLRRVFLTSQDVDDRMAHRAPTIVRNATIRRFAPSGRTRCGFGSRWESAESAAFRDAPVAQRTVLGLVRVLAGPPSGIVITASQATHDHS
jgi:hypothetical protein